MRPPNEAETLLAIHMKEVFGEAEPEYRFHPIRKWRFDVACPTYMVAAEVQGSIWTQGRHSRGVGMQSDMEKLNSALCMGWTPFTFSTKDVMEGRDLITFKAWKFNRNNQVRLCDGCAARLNKPKK